MRGGCWEPPLPPIYMQRAEYICLLLGHLERGGKRAGGAGLLRGAGGRRLAVGCALCASGVRSAEQLLQQQHEEFVTGG